MEEDTQSPVLASACTRLGVCTCPLTDIHHTGINKWAHPWSKGLKAACIKSVPGILITNKASSSTFQSCVIHHQPPPLQVQAQVGSCLLCRFAAFSHRATFLLNRSASQASCVLCLSCYYIERAATSLWITNSSVLLWSRSFVLPCSFVICMWPFSSPGAEE